MTTTQSTSPRSMSAISSRNFGRSNVLPLHPASMYHRDMVMTDLVKEYGYYSSGESFSIADPNEVWILEMIGKGPGVQEMLYPTSYIKSKHLGKECALITDGRFSGGTSGLSIDRKSTRLNSSH